MLNFFMVNYQEMLQEQFDQMALLLVDVCQPKYPPKRAISTWKCKQFSGDLSPCGEETPLLTPHPRRRRSTCPPNAIPGSAYVFNCVTVSSQQPCPWIGLYICQLF